MRFEGLVNAYAGFTSVNIEGIWFVLHVASGSPHALPVNILKSSARAHENCERTRTFETHGKLSLGIYFREYRNNLVTNVPIKKKKNFSMQIKGFIFLFISINFSTKKSFTIECVFVKW